LRLELFQISVEFLPIIVHLEDVSKGNKKH